MYYRKHKYMLVSKDEHYQKALTSLLLPKFNRPLGLCGQEGVLVRVYYRFTAAEVALANSSKACPGLF